MIGVNLDDDDLDFSKLARSFKSNMREDSRTKQRQEFFKLKRQQMINMSRKDQMSNIYSKLEEYFIDHRIYDMKEQIAPNLFWYQERERHNQNYLVQVIFIDHVQQKQRLLLEIVHLIQFKQYQSPVFVNFFGYSKQLSKVVGVKKTKFLIFMEIAQETLAQHLQKKTNFALATLKTFVKETKVLLNKLETDLQVGYSYLSPEDFVITPQGKIKLYRTQMHPCKFFVDKPNVYMCPKLFRGLKPTKSSQYFSFGLILFKMVLGVEMDIRKRLKMTIQQEMDQFIYKNLEILKLNVKYDYDTELINLIKDLLMNVSDRQMAQPSTIMSQDEEEFKTYEDTHRTKHISHNNSSNKQQMQGKLLQLLQPTSTRQQRPHRQFQIYDAMGISTSHITGVKPKPKSQKQHYSKPSQEEFISFNAPSKIDQVAKEITSTTPHQLIQLKKIPQHQLNKASGFLKLGKKERKTLKKFHEYIRRVSLPQSDYNNKLRWITRPKDDSEFRTRMARIMSQIRKSQCTDHVKIFTCIGYCYARGWCGLPVNVEGAKKFFLKAIKQKDSVGYLIYAYYLLKGEKPFEQNQEEAIALYKSAAGNGQSDAMNWLGGSYQKKGELTQSIEYYTKAAELNNADALNNLALCYDNAMGVDKSVEKAITYYKKAAELGHSQAMNNLAICYQNGDGVERNMEKAFELYSKAFVCGSVDAGFNSAVCTENGWGTQENKKRASDIYEKCGIHGKSDGYLKAGLIYKKGIAGQMMADDKRAKKLFIRASKMGNKQAQELLKTME